MLEELKITDLTKVYPNGKKANDTINITVHKGEVVGIIGPNGAGKTTLIRQILGLLAPTSGKIEIFGEDISQKTGFIKKNVSYAPQTILYYPSLTVKETIEFALKFRGYRGKMLSDKLKETLIYFRLEQVKDFVGYQLSPGLARLLLVSIAFAQNTPILILDEPTAMLDIVTKAYIWKNISELSNKIVLIASHDMNEIRNLCNKVYLIIKGKIIAEGSPEDISTLMKMPTEITFIPVNSDKAEKVVLYAKTAAFKKEGNVFNVAFEQLDEGIDFIKEISDSSGIRYLQLESPSFEKTVLKFLEEKNE